MAWRHRVPQMLADARRNIELKARDKDRSLEACRALGAVDHRVIEQLDTYFNVASRRLKLREETLGGSSPDRVRTG